MFENATAAMNSPRTWVISFYEVANGETSIRRIDNVSAADLGAHIAQAADDIATDDIHSIVEVEDGAFVVIERGKLVIVADLEKF